MKPKLFGRLAAAVVLLLSAATATAHDFEVDGIYYKYNDDGITVSVTFKGDYYASYDNEYTDTVIIPESVSYSGQTYSVTAIGASAFSGCSKLISVKLPESITQIVSWAFSYCSSLTSIVIPNSVISIGSYAFSDCI